MHLLIADFTLRITSELPIYMEEGYQPFLQEGEIENPDINIECLSGIPEDFQNVKTFLFEAEDRNQKFYSIFKHKDGLGFYIYDQQDINTIQQIALLDETLTNWKIFSRPLFNGTLFPLKYPMGPILMYYLTVNNEAVMMHASGIFNGKKGRLFTGFSGYGKSTMSRLWQSCGNLVINDDRLIIRKQDGGFFMHNTPMYYTDQPKKSPVSAVHLIRHASENSSKKVTGAQAVSKVLAFCIQNNFDKQFIQNHLSFMSELCSAADVYETGFLPDTDIVRYIQENDY